jgi:hypothetical protein
MGVRDIRALDHIGSTPTALSNDQNLGMGAGEAA